MNVLFLIIFPPLRVSIRRLLIDPGKKQKPNDNNIFTMWDKERKEVGKRVPLVTACLLCAQHCAI